MFGIFSIFSNSVLARRLVVSIILFSSVITLIITLLQINSRYQQELSDFHSIVAQIETTSLESISRSVWVIDDQQIQTAIDGLVELND